MSEVTQTEINKMTKEQNYLRGYYNGRLDFIEKHTKINFLGKPFIFISDEEYEELMEQLKERE